MFLYYKKRVDATSKMSIIRKLDVTIIAYYYLQYFLYWLEARIFTGNVKQVGNTNTFNIDHLTVAK